MSQNNRSVEIISLIVIFIKFEPPQILFSPNQKDCLRKPAIKEGSSVEALYATRIIWAHHPLSSFM